MKQFGPTPQLLVTHTTAVSAATDSVTGELDPHLLLVTKVIQQFSSWQTLETAEALLAHADITVVNHNRQGVKIEQVRTVVADSAYPPYQTKEKLVILLHLEQASLPAQQALLKFLEEPPAYLRILATTSQLDAILPTIQSRSQVVVLTEPMGVVPPQTTNQPDHNQLLQKILTQQLSLTEVIKVAEHYPDRPEAIAFLGQLLEQLKNHSSYPNPHTITTAQTLTENWRKLHQNTNVRLTLEHCFFTIISRF